MGWVRDVAAGVVGLLIVLLILALLGPAAMAAGV